MAENRILITGGAGFIGSHLVEAYLKAGWSVGVIDDLSTGKKANIANYDTSFFQVDILDQAALESVFATFKPTHLSHHAAAVSVRRSIESPALDAQINIIGTINLLQACLKYNLKQFSFASSGGAIYGEVAHDPADENYPKSPTSPYGLAKLAAETYISWFSSVYGLPVTILRYANVYGPRQDPAGEAGVISLFLDRFSHHLPALIYGDGNQLRDFVSVTDVACANVAASTGQKTGIYNIASGTTTNINQLYKLIATAWQNHTGQPLPAPEYRAAIAGETYSSKINIDKARSALNWQPVGELGECLAKLVSEDFSPDKQ